MPVFAFSAGSILRKKYSENFELRLSGMVKFLFIILVFQAILYLALYRAGYVTRLGNSIPFLIPILYFTIYKSSNYMYLMPLSIVVTGKRVTLLSILFIGLIAARKNLAQNFKKILFPFILFAGIIFYLKENLAIFFARWDISAFFQSDFTIGVIDRLSSGRIGQWLGGIATIDTPYKFFFGSGSGTKVQYIVLEGGSTTAEISWYVHNAAISYFMQTGLVGALLLIVLFCIILWRARGGKNNLFTFYYFWLVMLSVVFSANLLINPLFWFFAGALYSSGAPKHFLKPV